MRTLSIIIVVLLKVNAIAQHNNEFTFKPILRPNSVYHIQFTSDYFYNVDLNSPEVILDSITKHEAVDTNMMSTTKSQSINSSLHCGDLSDDGSFQIIYKYHSVIVNDSLGLIEQPDQVQLFKTLQSTTAYGRVYKDQKFNIDSISGLEDKNIEHFIVTDLNEIIQQYEFPKQFLKTGDTFEIAIQTETPANYNFQNIQIPEFTKLNYKIDSIIYPMAFFEIKLVNNELFDESDLDFEIINTGKSEYDIKNRYNKYFELELSANTTIDLGKISMNITYRSKIKRIISLESHDDNKR